MTLADRIQLAMKKRKLKQVDLVNLTGIPQSTLSLYIREGHIPKKEVLQTIADALDVSVFWLKGYDEYEKIPETTEKISAVLIGKLIEAHYEKNEQKFKDYAEFIHSKYTETRDDRSAKIIRNKIDGVIGTQVALDEISELEEIVVIDKRGQSDLVEIKNILREIAKKLEV
jgi:transcriptional regulator with XRE-family HTH domain